MVFFGFKQIVVKSQEDDIAVICFGRISKMGVCKLFKVNRPFLFPKHKNLIIIYNTNVSYFSHNRFP